MTVQPGPWGGHWQDQDPSAVCSVPAVKCGSIGSEHYYHIPYTPHACHCRQQVTRPGWHKSSAPEQLNGRVMLRELHQ